MQDANVPDSAGFVLLEILMALVIFATLVLAYAKTTDDALVAAAEANADRTLRLLCSRKLAEVRAKPAEFIDGGEGGFEEEVEPGAENPFLDYHWTLEAETLVAAGYSTDKDAAFLFERDEAGGAPSVPEGGKAPDPVKLVRFRLKVSRIPEGGDESEQMRAVTFVPAPPEEGKQGAGK
jgi:prepilin-type N-terminal cleavage/methylation domain-containing protein